MISVVSSQGGWHQEQGPRPRATPQAAPHAPSGSELLPHPQLPLPRGMSAATQGGANGRLGWKPSTHCLAAMPDHTSLPLVIITRSEGPVVSHWGRFPAGSTPVPLLGSHRAPSTSPWGTSQLAQPPSGSHGPWPFPPGTIPSWLNPCRGATEPGPFLWGNSRTDPPHGGARGTPALPPASGAISSQLNPHQGPRPFRSRDPSGLVS